MKSIVPLLLIFCTQLTNAQDFSFEQFFDSRPQLKKIAEDEMPQVQIIYTEIDRDHDNTPSFTSHSFQVDSGLYFYPASTVKMPTAFLALQRLRELGIDKNTALRIGADRFPQTAVRLDSSAQSGLPSIAHYIRKIFLYSDNDAYNRLFEFLGQEYINSELRKKGFGNSNIKHRLLGGYDGNENQYINPLWFYRGDSIIYHRVGRKSAFDFSTGGLQKLIRGKGYWDGERTVEGPFDFSKKNFIALQDLHDQLRAVLFPEVVPAGKRFDLSEEDYDFLYKCMSRLPRQSENPICKEADNHVKFIFFGDEDEQFRVPDDIRVFNKVGFAYGFLTDVAYVVDREQGIEFLLAVQMLVNENEIFNDGEYEYVSLGIPFMGQLGKAIYARELARERRYRPALEKFFPE